MRTWIHSLTNNKHSARRPNRHASKHVSHSRRGAFETLEARLALAVDLGFAAAFESLGGTSNNTTSSHLLGGATGMVTDVAGNSYIAINGGPDQGVDLDPGPAVQAATLDAALVKLDPSGALVWAASLNATGGASPVARLIHAVDADQNVYLVGDFRGTVDFDPGAGVMNVTSSQAGAGFSVYLSKLNSAGQLQWVHTLTGSGLRPDAFTLDGDGNLVIVANFAGAPIDVDPGSGEFLVQPIGSSDTLVLKYNPDGDFLWARQLGGVGANIGDVPSVAVDGQGEVYIAGGYKGSVDLDPGAGVHLVTNSDAGLDGFVVRLNPAGDFVWAYVTEGNGQTRFRDIDIAGGGSIVVSGQFTGTVDFDAGSGTLPLTAVSSLPTGLVLKLASDSSIAWARQYGSNATGQTLGRGVDVDQEGNIYLTGSFGAYGPTDFDPGPGVYDLIVPNSGTAGYVLSLTEDSDFRWAVPLGGNVSWTGVESVSVTPDGDVHVSGAFRKTADFDPSVEGETWLSSGAVQSVFAVTLTQSDPIPGAPTVTAGQDQIIVVTSSANLNGTVTDDGLPNPLTTTWSLVSGPGTVTFADASAIDTTATFSTSGNYWLRLEATDGQFTTTDYVYIMVDPATATLAATADAYLDGGNKTSNYGAASSLIVDGNPDNGALLKWNLSSIPVGSTLQSATLSLNVTGTSADTYEIYELKRNWTELQATWNNAATGTKWQSAGAQGALDRGSTVLGTITATATGIRNVVLNAAGLAVVQGWVNNPATNFGFIIQDYVNTNKDDLVFSSKEATVVANRPQLQLVYNPPSVAPLSLRTVAAMASATGTGDMLASKLVQTSTGRDKISAVKLVQRASLVSPQDDALLAWLASRYLNQENATGKSSIRPDATAAGDADQDESNESLDAAFASLAIGGH